MKSPKPPSSPSGMVSLKSFLCNKIGQTGNLTPSKNEQMHNLDKGPSCGHSWGRLFNPWNPWHLAICSLPDTEKVKICCSQGSTNPLTHRSLQWIHLNWSQWKRMPYNSSRRIRKPPAGSPWRCYNLSQCEETGNFEEWFGNPLGQAYHLHTQKSHPCPHLLAKPKGTLFESPCNSPF